MNSTSDELRILIVEDVKSDAELVEYELRSAGLKFLSRRVETEEGFLKELSDFLPDIILSDYSLPAFGGLAALKIIRERMPDTPFVFVTGVLDEKLAIELLKEGATDYVLKSRLSRLPIAVLRAIRDARDKKERVQTQAALKQTEHMLRKVATAVEQAAEGVMITDREGRVEYVNPAFTKISGYGDEDLIGQEYTVLWRVHDDKALYNAVWSTIKAGKVWKGRLELKKKDGAAYTVEETISPIKDRAGAIVSCVFVVREVTEQIRLEEQLRRAQKLEAIGTLAAGIADDFNNILAGIIGFVEIMLEDAPPDSPEQKRLEFVLKGAHRGRDLVKQILAFSSRTEQKEERVALSRIVEDGMKAFRRGLPPEIEIVTKILTKEDTILADPGELQEVLINLCMNAVQAMGSKGGSVEVDVADASFVKSDPLPLPDIKPGQYVILTVRDRGCGMEHETIERMFDPFFTTKNRRKGTGLGLSVVHGIIKSHGGYVNVESEPKKGTAVHIYLPKVT